MKSWGCSLVVKHDWSSISTAAKMRTKSKNVWSRSQFHGLAGLAGGDQGFVEGSRGWSCLTSSRLSLVSGLGDDWQPVRHSSLSVAFPLAGLGSSMPTWQLQGPQTSALLLEQVPQGAWGEDTGLPIISIYEPPNITAKWSSKSLRLGHVQMWEN